MNIAILTLVGLGLAYTVAMVLVAATERARHRRRNIATADVPAISVLKPMKGVDDCLEGNLRSFFELDYPQFELIFGFNDNDDPAIDLVRRLMSEYPNIKSRIVVNEFRVGLNPKINNLHNMYPYAAHDLLVISDSNVRVRADYLFDLANHMMSPKVGLVTSTIHGTGARKLGSVFENVHMNTFVAGSVLAVHKLVRIPISIGKSLCIRRQTLGNIGGFKAFQGHLAEDHLMSISVQNLGLKVRTSFHGVDSVNVSWDISRFLGRHLRWAMMRRHINLFHYCVEILANPIFVAFAFVLANGFDRNSIAMFAGVGCVKIILDTIIGLLTCSEKRLAPYLLIPVKDLMMGFLWVVPFFVNTVSWRGNRFVMQRNTELYPAGNSTPPFAAILNQLSEKAEVVWSGLSRVTSSAGKAASALKSTGSMTAYYTRRLLERAGIGSTSE